MVKPKYIATVAAVIVASAVIKTYILGGFDRFDATDAAQGTLVAAAETIPQIADEVQHIEQETAAAEQHADTRKPVLDRAATERLLRLWR